MKFKDEQNNVYYVNWSNNTEENLEKDYTTVCNEVFGKQSMTKEKYKRKFHENIYGPSLIVVVYDDQGAPIAARSFWRNDIDGKVAYQPGDTGIIEKARGKGIFGKMTKYALNQINSDAIIYNYPNDNSLNGYLKMGWSIVGEYRLKFLFSKSIIKKVFRKPIDDKYVNWWLINNDSGNKSYFKYKNEIYLVNKKKYFGVIIGKISNNIDVTKLPYYKGFLCYRAQDTTLYNRNRRPLIIVANLKYGNEIDIPIYKMDALS